MAEELKFRADGELIALVAKGGGGMSGLVYFCDLGNGAWMAYICSGSGLTDCEWLIPESFDPEK